MNRYLALGAALMVIGCTGDGTTDKTDTTDTVTDATDATDTTDSGTEAVSLADDVVPIISRECGFCHTRTKSPNPYAVANKVYLETSDDLLGLVGSFIMAGDSANSGFIAVLEQTMGVGTGDTLMPPPASKRPAMSKADVAVVAQWIDEGALDN